MHMVSPQETVQMVIPRCRASCDCVTSLFYIFAFLLNVIPLLMETTRAMRESNYTSNRACINVADWDNRHLICGIGKQKAGHPAKPPMEMEV